MSKSLCRAAAALFFWRLLSPPLRASAEELIGTWLTQNADAQIRVGEMRQGAVRNRGVAARRNRCQDRQAAGRRQESRSKHAQPRRFRHPNFRDGAGCTGSWTGGIYNSDDGKTYKGRLAPHGEDELEVQGCAGSLCGSEVWTRAK